MCVECRFMRIENKNYIFSIIVTRQEIFEISCSRQNLDHGFEQVLETHYPDLYNELTQNAIDIEKIRTILLNLSLENGC